jgi:F-type H+-transporting ATPase subunit b
MKHWLGWSIVLLAFLCTGSNPAIAQSEEAAIEGEEHEEHDEGAIPDPIERWFNFLVLFGGLGLLLRKPAAEFFESRRGAIQGGLDRARAAQRDADVRMNDITGRLARFDSEVQRLQSDAARSARAEEDRILKDTRIEVDRAITQSRAEVDRLAKGLEHEIRAGLADQVIARAEEQLRTQMTIEDQQRAVRKAVDNL